MALSGDTLAVADYDRIHLVSRVGRLLGSLGRRGEGPGEFKNIGGLSVLSDGTLLVWDTGLLRLTWMSSGGQVLATRRVTPPAAGFANASDDLGLCVIEGGVVLAWRPSMRGPNHQEELLLTWLSLKDSEREQTIIARVPGLFWVDAGGVVVPQYPFGPRAIAAVAGGGRIAHSEGVEYCVTVQTVAGNDVRILCAEWNRSRVSREDIDPKQISNLSQRERTLLAKRAEVAEFGEEKNSVDALRFDERGRLWVRVVDDSVKYDRLVRGLHPEVQPPTYLWHVYLRSGRRLTAIRLDSRFDPVLFEAGKVYGTLRTVTGEYTIATVNLPPELH